MLKGKSNKWAYLKYLCILPVSVAVSTVFARPEIAGKFEQVSEAKISDFFQEKKTDPEIRVTGKVTSLRADSTGQVIRIEELGEMRPLIVIDGKVVTPEEFTELVPEKIDAITVLKDGAAIEQYGEEGTNGVIIITTKPTGEESNPQGARTIKRITHKRDSVSSVTVIRSDTVFGDQPENREERRREVRKEINIQVNPTTEDLKNQLSQIGIVKLDKTSYRMPEEALYMIDGVEMTHEKFQAIDPKTIKTITVLKGEAAIKEYGNKGKNGAIIVSTLPDHGGVIQIKVSPEATDSLFSEVKERLRKSEILTSNVEKIP